MPWVVLALLQANPRGHKMPARIFILQVHCINCPTNQANQRRKEENMAELPMSGSADTANHHYEDDRESPSAIHLLSGYRMGEFSLSHRIVLAPMTRCRALNQLPQPAHVEFYSQRATNGGLLITEAVAVADAAFGFPHTPGIFTKEQVDAWKPVVNAVHARGGVIFCQLWHVGRASHAVYQPGGSAPVSSTSREISESWTILMPDGSREPFPKPRSLNVAEIHSIIHQFRVAARNAMDAGFDGVEIHGAHGYLIDQFLKDGINDRCDAYGGSLENRCRLALEILEAVCEEIGAGRTGFRISPRIHHLCATDSDPLGLGLYLIRQLNRRRHPLCYLHLTHPRFTANGVVTGEDDDDIYGYHRRIRNAYEGTLISSGGYTRDSGMAAVANGDADLISYGRLFISNPDLPLRFALGSPLNKYDKSTFYTHHQVVGYTDYPGLRQHYPLDHDGDDDRGSAKDAIWNVGLNRALDVMHGTGAYSV